MKTLIAIVSCLRFSKRVELLRRTWVPMAAEVADVKVFTGKDLEVEDDYQHLRQKVQAVFRWAVAEGYDQIVKCDDDVYLIPERLFTINTYDYRGRMRAPSREQGGPELYGPRESSYCSGFTYILNRRSAKIVGDAPDNGDWAEDRFVGNTLARYGIFPVHDVSFMLWPSSYGERHFCTYPNPSCTACQNVFRNASVLCPHERVDAIPELHRWYTETGFIPTHFPKETSA